MQLSPVISPLASPLAGLPTGTGTSSKSSQGEASTSAATRTESAPNPATQAATEDSVSVSPQARTQEANQAPAPIYAEIWKGSVKVAQVDIHGRVISLTGVVSSGGGGSVAGAMLAAQRAVQVAREVGGEIRSAGQPLDGQTLLMRARLANTYGT